MVKGSLLTFAQVVCKGSGSTFTAIACQRVMWVVNQNAEIFIFFLFIGLFDLKQPKTFWGV